LKLKMLLFRTSECCSVAGHVIRSIHCHYVLSVFCIIILLLFMAIVHLLSDPPM